MKTKSLFAGLMVLVFAGLRGMCDSAQAGLPSQGMAWQVSEWTFATAKDYSAGGGDAVEFDVAFAQPGTGRTLVRPAFWDGGSTFRVRFAPMSAGRWSWKVRCPSDATLDGRSGTFDVRPYAGDLALYRHGFVTIVPGKKHFVHADGTPFLYLGDTHWGMYREEIDAPGPHAGKTGATSHFKYIVARRAQQGFTVYQSEPIGARFDVRDGRVDAVDIPGFRHADLYYQAIAEAGLVHANAEFFFAAELTPALAKDDAALARLSRYWVARFGAYPVIWTLAQEIDKDFYHERKAKHNFYTVADNPWVRVAEYLHRYDAYAHPLSGHQQNTGTTTVHNSVFVAREVAARTGHTWWAAQWSPALKGPVDWRVPREYWASKRPAVNYEGRYCYLWTKNFGARAQGWISFLNGFCGYGYGAIDQWLYLSDYDVKRDSHDGVERITKADKQVPWCASLEFPSARQMGLLRTFLEKLPWWELEPDLGTGRFFAPAKGAVASVAAKGADLYVGYFNGFSTATGRFAGCRPGVTYACTWFNPRTGEEVAVPVRCASERGDLALPEKPDAQDWVFTARRIEHGKSNG